MEKSDVSLVAISGDISTTAEEDSFRKFSDIVSQYDFPVYSCTGNHDVGYGDIWDLWRECVNPDVYADPDRTDIVLADNGIDFVYRGDGLAGDVFIFLSQRYWDYNREESRLLDDSQLDWLEEQFEQYKDRTVYLFFHTFMADDNNDPTMGEGNLINNKGVTYDLTYTVGTADEVADMIAEFIPVARALIGVKALKITSKASTPVRSMTARSLSQKSSFSTSICS